MKPLNELTCCVVDAGTFIPLADMLGRATKKTWYYSPFEQEYLNLHRCCIGDGMEHFDRLDEFLEPDIFKAIDLFVFPDIGYGGTQRYLRSVGKLVWGAMGASDLELYRTRFLKVITDLGLPMVPSVPIRGLTALTEHLQGCKRKWVKMNRYRDNAETWFHLDYEHSQRELERQAMEFGPLKERIVYVVQDEIADEGDTKVLEVGYDGWCIDGKFPSHTFQGYEKKNQLYLGSLLKDSDLPEPVKLVNEAMSPVLSEYGYRNFFATEIRVKDGTAYFIDPTARMAGQTQEHLLDTCTNLADVIYRGAAGEVIEPEFSHSFTAEATLHYKAANEGSGWKTFKVPEAVADKVKLYRCCFDGEAYQFPPHKSDELGVVIGQGNSIEEAIQDLSDNFGELEEEPVSIELSGFADLLTQIQAAEKQGVEFSDQTVPEPESVIAGD